MYATDTNVLKTTAVPLTCHIVHGVGLVMKKARATEGVLGGHALSTACAPPGHGSTNAHGLGAMCGSS